MSMIQAPRVDTEGLSRQEWAIETGARSVHGNVTDRVLRLHDAIRATYRPKVALERAVYFTESFQTTEGQPLVLRWAKALKHITEHISVAIFDDELIVGRPNTWLGRYTLVTRRWTAACHGRYRRLPEGGPGGSREAIIVTAEDRKIMDGSVPVLECKDFLPNFVRALPQESRLISFGPDPDNLGLTQNFVVISTGVWPLPELDPDWGKLSGRGCRGIRRRPKPGSRR